MVVVFAHILRLELFRVQSFRKSLHTCEMRTAYLSTRPERVPRVQNLGYCSNSLQRCAPAAAEGAQIAPFSVSAHLRTIVRCASMDTTAVVWAYLGAKYHTPGIYNNYTPNAAKPVGLKNQHPLRGNDSVSLSDSSVSIER